MMNLTPTTAVEKRKRFKERLAKPEPILAPGVFNPLSARIVEEVGGFECIYVGGANIALDLGLADLGLVSMTEHLSAVRYIANSVSLPVFCDIDTGYGGVLNVWRTIKEFEEAGVVGVHIEDQVTPKRCGHLEGKELVSTKEMVQKIKIAVDTRIDPNFVIIARTDARVVEGFDAAIERANKYVEAGADVTFFESPLTIEEMEKIPKLIPVPQQINMVEGGKTPLLSLKDLGNMGYRIVHYGNALSRACMKAMHEMLEILKENGTTLNHQHLMYTWEEFNDLVRTTELEDIERKYNIKN